MKWLVTILLILPLLAACSGSVIEQRDVAVSQQPNLLELGNNCASIDVTETKISTY